MLTSPSSEKALAAGGVILANAEEYVPNWPLTGGWALREWAEKNHGLVVRFIRAWVKATDWLLRPEHREETIQLIMKLEGLSRARAEKSCRNVVPKARIDPAALLAVLKLRREMGVYRPPFSPAEHFYDAGYWCEATGLPAPQPAGMPEGVL